MNNKYYIKEGDVWLGPLSGTEFEFRKVDAKEFIYWKPEFCSNHVLHPHLCKHAKKWIKPKEVVKENVEEKAIVEPLPIKTREVILGAEALETDDNTVKSEEEIGKQQQTKPQKDRQNQTKEAGIGFKLLVIIIGFILILVAGMYVNSKLSIMFYQDIIIQESVKNIEYFSRDMINESKEMKKNIDTLNAVAGREFKAVNKEIKAIRADLNKLKQNK